MAQDRILDVIKKNPWIDGNGIKKELKLKYGVAGQLERLRKKNLIIKKQGDTRLSWRYKATGKEEESNNENQR